jgi:uncharacterized membrane protein YfcA
MTFSQGLILFCAAILGGTLNAVAGGGSFICFPALVFTGLPAISANATNSVALWPGSVASVGAYRRELARQTLILLILMISMSLIGGILGALLLLKTPPEIFVRLVPYLLLVATLLFTFSGPITARLRRQRLVGSPMGAVGIVPNASSARHRVGARHRTGASPVRPYSADPIPIAPTLEKEEQANAVLQLNGIEGQATTATLGKETLSVPMFVGLSFAQLVIAVYGGYFGGGIGILMLAALAMIGMSDIHVMNALKTLLASCINGVAVITFIVAGVVAWPQAILMIIGAVIGGYGGAYYARKISQKWVRLFVIVVGFSMTIYFLFLRK